MIFILVDNKTGEAVSNQLAALWCDGLKTPQQRQSVFRSVQLLLMFLPFWFHHR